MTYEEILENVKALKIPVFYSEDKSKEHTLPRIIFQADSERQWGSDSKNYIAETSYTLQLVTRGRDVETERKLDKILSFAELDKNWTYDGAENVMTTMYFFSLTTKI